MKIATRVFMLELDEKRKNRDYAKADVIKKDGRRNIYKYNLSI